MWNDIFYSWIIIIFLNMQIFNKWFDTMKEAIKGNYK